MHSIAIHTFLLNEISKERNSILNFEASLTNLRKWDVSKMSMIVEEEALRDRGAAKDEEGIDKGI